MGALALVALGFLIFLVLGSLDTEDPVVTPSEKIAVIVPKSGFNLKAGDAQSGLKEVKVTLTQGGQEKVVMDLISHPGARLVPP